MGIISKLFKKDVYELSDAGWFLKAHSLWHHEKGNFYKPKEALKYLDQAIKLNPNKGEAYGSRGIAYFQLRNYLLTGFKKYTKTRDLKVYQEGIGT